MTLLNVTAVDYDFQGVKLYNPTITEISEKINDEEDLFFAIKLLSSSLMTFITLENTPQEFSDFDILFALFREEKASFELFSKEKIKALKELLLLLFKDYKLSIGDDEFIFSKDNSVFILNSKNFKEFQEILSDMFKTSFLFNSNGEQDFNPASEEARKIAEKLKKSREKIAELNGDRNHKTALIENYIMIVATGLHQNPKILADTLTLYQLFTVFMRIKMRLEWDLDVDCRLAGGNPEEHPDQWMSII